MVEPVFTAHPTEATRRAILEKQQWIARDLVERLDAVLTPPEERGGARRGCARTSPPRGRPRSSRASGPAVADEREHVLFFLADVVYRVVPPFYEELESALAAVFGEQGAAVRAPEVLRFGSWVGGDMDGNPNVSADTIRESLERHRALILGRYRDEMLGLWERLTQSTARVGVDRRGARSGSPNTARASRRAPPRSARVTATCRTACCFSSSTRGCWRPATTRAERYERPEELLDDLRTIAASLEHIAASTPACSGCGAWRAASAPSAFTWRRSTCARTRASIARWWGG